MDGKFSDENVLEVALVKKQQQQKKKQKKSFAKNFWSWNSVRNCSNAIFFFGKLAAVN